jgi:hypothetical protein
MPPRPIWRRILIHHSAGHDTGGLDIDAIDRMHRERNGWKMIGYHYVVEQVGASYHAIAARPLHLAGAHCPGRNTDSLGVCLVGNFEERNPPPDQLEAAAQLAAGLCSALQIPIHRIDRHKDHKATACPGQHFDLAIFRHRVETILK